jgi:ACT domain-containing protein
MDNLVILSKAQLDALCNNMYENVVKAIKEEKEKDLQEKLLSPEEAMKLFKPEISRTTLYRWEKAGLIVKYSNGRSSYYKYSEIMASLKTVKKYKSAIQ